jgi:hypothetical protein
LDYIFKKTEISQQTIEIPAHPHLLQYHSQHPNHGISLGAYQPVNGFGKKKNMIYDIIKYYSAIKNIEIMSFAGK